MGHNGLLILFRKRASPSVTIAGQRGGVGVGEAIAATATLNANVREPEKLEDGFANADAPQTAQIGLEMRSDGQARLNSIEECCEAAKGQDEGLTRDEPATAGAAESEEEEEGEEPIEGVKIAPRAAPSAQETAKQRRRKKRRERLRQKAAA